MSLQWGKLSHSNSAPLDGSYLYMELSLCLASAWCDVCGVTCMAQRTSVKQIKPWCRASTSRSGLIGHSDHTESSAALASARADAAQLKEENTRLLDLLSTVRTCSTFEG